MCPRFCHLFSLSLPEYEDPGPHLSPDISNSIPVLPWTASPPVPPPTLTWSSTVVGLKPSSPAPTALLLPCPSRLLCCGLCDPTPSPAYPQSRHFPGLPTASPVVPSTPSRSRFLQTPSICSSVRCSPPPSSLLPILPASHLHHQVPVPSPHATHSGWISISTQHPHPPITTSALLPLLLLVQTMASNTESHLLISLCLDQPQLITTLGNFSLQSNWPTPCFLKELEFQDFVPRSSLPIGIYAPWVHGPFKVGAVLDFSRLTLSVNVQVDTN